MSKLKLTGKVQEALTYLKMHFEDYPDEALRFTELRIELVYDASNFRDRVRKHESFKAGLEVLGVEEVTVGNYRHRNAFTKKPAPFGPVEGSSYVADV